MRLRNSDKIFYLFILIALPALNSYSQDYHSNYSLFGNSGIIETPSANLSIDKSVGLSISYLPESYRVLKNNPDHSSELHYNLNIVFLPFAEITASLIRPMNGDSPSGGIGDRSFKLKLLLLQEREYIPALAIGLHDPAGANTNNGAAYIVGSKKLELFNDFKLDLNIGYGLDITTKKWERTRLFMDDGSKNISRLNGLFGGFAINYNRAALLVEYDTNKINLGLSYSFCKYFDIKIIAIETKEIAVGIAINLN